MIFFLFFGHYFLFGNSHQNIFKERHFLLGMNTLQKFETGLESFHKILSLWILLNKIFFRVVFSAPARRIFLVEIFFAGVFQSFPWQKDVVAAYKFHKVYDHKGPSYSFGALSLSLLLPP